MSRVRIIIAGLTGAYLVLTLLDRFKLIELLVIRTGLPLVLVLIESIAIIGCGFALRSRRWPELDPSLDFLLGYPLFGALCFLAGTISVSRWMMVLVLTGSTLFGAFALARWWETRQADSGQKDADSRSTFDSFALICLGIVLLCAGVFVQAPPVNHDELAHHLAIPKTWVLEGRAIDLPLSSHSYFPLGIESADLPFLTLLGNDGALASHLLHLFAAIGATLLIQRRTKNLLVTAAIATTPALAIAAGCSLVDWPLAGVTAALWIALEERDDKGAAAAVGAGLLIAYTFIPIAGIALIVARRWRPAMIGVAAGSVFFLRNVVLAGNPFAGAFEMLHGGTGFLSEYVFGSHLMNDSMGASLLALAPFVTGIVPIALLAAGIALFFLAPAPRVLIPFFIAPAMSAEPAVRARKWAAWILAIAIGVQTIIIFFLTDRSEAFTLLTVETEQSFRTKHLTSFASITWLNQTLPSSSRTLVIGTSESFWFSRCVRACGEADSTRVAAYLEAPAAEALREKLRRDGITHVAVLQKAEERQTHLTPAAQKTLAMLLDHFTSAVTAQGDATLFELK